MVNNNNPPQRLYVASTAPWSRPYDARPLSQCSLQRPATHAPLSRMTAPALLAPLYPPHDNSNRAAHHAPCDALQRPSSTYAPLVEDDGVTLLSMLPLYLPHDYSNLGGSRPVRYPPTAELHLTLPSSRMTVSCCFSSFRCTFPPCAMPFKTYEPTAHFARMTASRCFSSFRCTFPPCAMPSKTYEPTAHFARMTAPRCFSSFRCSFVTYVTYGIWSTPATSSG